MKEEEKKTTKRTSTKKSTTPKKEETEVKKKTRTKKISSDSEEVKALPEEKKETTKKTTAKKTTTKKVTTKKATTKKASTKKKTTEVKELPPVVDDIELENNEEIEVETVPEENIEKTEEIAVQEESNTDALPVVVPVKEEKNVDEITDDTIAAIPLPMEELGKSVFDGKLIQLIGWWLIGLILTVVTLGLGFPFAKCFILDWRFKHTKINGKRLSFDGNGLQLWGNYIKWTIFSIFTLGIFLLFLPVQWNKWIVKHTHYEGNKKPKVNYSLFDGITWEYIGISILSGILNFFSLGLLAPFCENLMYSWRINHTTYDTIDMEFDGKGFQLLGNYIKWTFLTIITLGIYGLWVPIRKIQWEVKHTHEKGYAKHPYKPVLGMILPIAFALVCLGGQIYGLTKVPKSTWKDINNSIKESIKSYKREIKKYDWNKILGERVADLYYMIGNKDSKITWDERYERYLNPTKLDKFVDNNIKDYFKDNNEVEMTFVDVANTDNPVMIIKDNKQIRIFWLYENKVENHYFNYDEDNGKLMLVSDKDGSHLAYVVNKVHDLRYEINVYYLDDIVNYKVSSKLYAANQDEYNNKAKDNGMKIEEADIHFSDLNLKNLDGYKEAVKYYYDHTNIEYNKDIIVYNEDEVNEYVDDSNYRSAYLSYLKNKITDKAKVAIVSLKSQEYPALVVLESDKSYILSYYDNELFESEVLGKTSLATIKKTTSSNNEYVLIGSDNDYRIYYFVESYAKHKTGTYEGQDSLKIKKKDLIKGLAKYSYKETNTSIEMINISKDDMKNLEEKLGIIDSKKEDDKVEEVDSIKAGEYSLAYGDYVSSVKDIAGGTYTLMRNGSYSYVNPYAKKNGKTYTIRETGKYEITMDYKRFIDGKGTGEKVPTICMKSSIKGSNNSSACFEVDKDNHFRSVQDDNSWTHKR